MPCCMSTTSESQPAWPMTSAEKLLGMPSQLLMTGLPACHNSRTPFGRAMGSSWVHVFGRRSRQLRRRVSTRGGDQYRADDRDKILDECGGPVPAEEVGQPHPHRVAAKRADHRADHT